jgi:hypothetical protein
MIILAIQNPPPVPKIKKVKEVAPKLPDKTKWTMEEQKQFFSALRIVRLIFILDDLLIYIVFFDLSMERISKHLVNFSILDVD